LDQVQSQPKIQLALFWRHDPFLLDEFQLGLINEEAVISSLAADLLAKLDCKTFLDALYGFLFLL
jgi:hypothetical protein